MDFSLQVFYGSFFRMILLGRRMTVMGPSCIHCIEIVIGKWARNPCNPPVFFHPVAALVSV